jgi:hypothetical protein
VDRARPPQALGENRRKYGSPEHWYWHTIY